MGLFGIPSPGEVIQSPRGRINPLYANTFPQDPGAVDMFVTQHPDSLIFDGETPSNYKTDPRVQEYLKALGNNQNTGSEEILGASNLPAEIQAPKLVAPNYAAAEAAMEAAKPHPISAPQYVQPNYAASDQLWDQGRPVGPTADQLDEDKWGRIISGMASGVLNADHQKFLSGVIGGLAGYGSALQNRTKMGVEQADKTSEYLMRKAGYTERKTADINQTQNNQIGANYNADRANQTENTSYYRALGGLKEGEATTGADVANKNAEYGYQADVRNAEIQAKRKMTVLGYKDNQVVYQYTDKDGNMIVGTKPLASFHGVNGNMQGKLPGAVDSSQAGLEQLIQNSKANGALRVVLGDQVYQQLTRPEQEYGSGALGDLAAHYGDAGKKLGLERAMADENNLIANYLQLHPDKLEALVGSIAGFK